MKKSRCNFLMQKKLPGPSKGEAGRGLEAAQEEKVNLKARVIPMRPKPKLYSHPAKRVLKQQHSISSSKPYQPKKPKHTVKTMSMSVLSQMQKAKFSRKPYKLCPVLDKSK